VIRTAVLVLAAGLLSGCGTDEAPAAKPTPARPSTASPTTPGTATATPTPEPRTGTVVISATSEYGSMLFDASGQPIYLFDKEHSSTAQCYGACADDWPPVLTTGLPRAAHGVREALLGTTARKDGTTQVTYAGHPLYFYAHEGKYQVRCHDVTEYGGTWLVVRPDGRAAAQAAETAGENGETLVIGL
jgi:predicted lipoprotein with Yx(FWY)xxD motif